MSEQQRESVLGRINTPTTPRLEPLPEDEHKAYSLVRGGHGLMLEVRYKNGNYAAFSYSYLVGINFDASGEMRIRFAGNKLTITGRNLKPVFDGLLHHSIGYLREMDIERDNLPETETFIDSITLEHTD